MSRPCLPYSDRDELITALTRVLNKSQLTSWKGTERKTIASTLGKAIRTIERLEPTVVKK